MKLSVLPNDQVDFTVVFEDEELIVVEKPAHLVTQPGLGHEDDTLLNGLYSRWGAKLQNLGKSRDFGLLHRLDRETSGLLVVALRARAYDELRARFEDRSVAKFYWALVEQTPEPHSGVIRRSIAEYEADNRRVKRLARVSTAGKPAATAYRVLSFSDKGALLECRAVTGRLHQVRVHLSSIGSPIVGDGLYGPGGVRRSRLALHAHRLKFIHPTTGMVLDIQTEWPSDLRSALTRLKLTKPVPSATVDDAHEVDGDSILDE